MIDFRYHLISIIAVLLALAIGILAGSGFLGGPVLADLKHRLNNIALDNSGLQKDVATLRKTTQQNQVFAQATEPWLVQTALAGSAIVLMEPQGTDSAASNNIVSAIATAGGAVRSTITFTDKLALADPTSINQLALIIHSNSGAGRKLRDQAATLLGQRAAAASRSLAVDIGKPSEDALRFDDLLNQLERNGFITRDQSQSGMAVAPGTLFVVLAGSVDHPPFPATGFCVTLARSLADHSAVVLAGEPSTSTWNFVSTVRADARAQKTVATVDNANTVPGGIAAVLGLREAIRGRIGHYGFGPGADDVIPQPVASPS
jgi:Copper transport outer membrane protein, MctB